MCKLTCFLCFIAATAAVADDPSARLSIPDAAALQEASRLVTEVYKAEYDKAKTQPQKLAHARKLLADAAAANEDPAGKFVLLRIAKDIAAQQGDLALALEAIEQAALTFQVDSIGLKVDAAEIALRPARLPNMVDESLAAVSPLLDQVMSDDRYEPARKIAALALATAKEVRDVEQIKRFTTLTKEIDNFEQQFLKVKGALAVLESKPTDPAANQTVGWYRCAVKGDFKSGTLMLALGNNEKLSTLAKRQIGPAPSPLELADAWWTVAEPLEGTAKSTVQSHAAEWYRQALPGLNGVAKTRVLARLKEFTKPPPIPATVTGLFIPFADCRQMAHEVSLLATFDPAKDWMLYVEARIPSFQSGPHQIVIWGDDRAGFDPIALVLQGNKLSGTADDCRTNLRTFVATELPSQTAGKWTKIAYVFRSADSSLQLFVNDKFVADAPCGFVPNADRGMPVRIGGASSDTQRFRGELRSLVFTNIR